MALLLSIPIKMILDVSHIHGKFCVDDRNFVLERPLFINRDITMDSGKFRVYSPWNCLWLKPRFNWSATQCQAWMYQIRFPTIAPGPSKDAGHDDGAQDVGSSPMATPFRPSSNQH